MRATVVKRVYGPDPAAWRDCRRAGVDLFFWVFLAAAWVFLPRGQGSGWNSARSRAAARTNELDAGKRRKISEGEEGQVAPSAHWVKVTGLLRRVPGWLG